MTPAELDSNTGTHFAFLRHQSVAISGTKQLTALQSERCDEFPSHILGVDGGSAPEIRRPFRKIGRNWACRGGKWWRRAMAMFGWKDAAIEPLSGGKWSSC